MVGGRRSLCDTEVGCVSVCLVELTHALRRLWETKQRPGNTDKWQDASEIVSAKTV